MTVDGQGRIERGVSRRPSQSGQSAEARGGARRAAPGPHPTMWFPERTRPLRCLHTERQQQARGLDVQDGSPGTPRAGKNRRSAPTASWGLEPASLLPSRSVRATWHRGVTRDARVSERDSWKEVLVGNLTVAGGLASHASVARAARTRLTVHAGGSVTVRRVLWSRNS